MMPGNKQLDDEQSDQKVNRIQDSEGSQQQDPDPTPAETEQKGTSSYADQPMQADREQQASKSREFEPQDTAREPMIEKPQETKTVSAGDMPGTPRLTDEVELPWFKTDELDELHTRWTNIQIQFVEDPCSAVEQCEAMVAETAERIKQMISDQQQSLSQQWLNHDDITTEELRATLLSYRALLNSLLKL